MPRAPERNRRPRRRIEESDRSPCLWNGATCATASLYRLVAIFVVSKEHSCYPSSDDRRRHPGGSRRAPTLAGKARRAFRSSSSPATAAGGRRQRHTRDVAQGGGAAPQPSL